MIGKFDAFWKLNRRFWWGMIALEFSPLDSINFKIFESQERIWINTLLTTRNKMVSVTWIELIAKSNHRLSFLFASEQPLIFSSISGNLDLKICQYIRHMHLTWFYALSIYFSVAWIQLTINYIGFCFCIRKIAYACRHLLW